MSGQATNSKTWWEERYQKSNGFIYSKEPSKFLMDYLDLIPRGGKILEIASGEGRNAVALAVKDFDVTAIDYAESAMARAKKLATESGISGAKQIQWKSSDLDFFIPELLTYDAIVSIDFKPPITLLKNLTRGLKQGGHVFMEAHLLEAMKTNSSLEAFECYKPNELLQSLNPQSVSLQVLSYSELNPAKWGDKVFFIGKKTQLL